MSLIPEQTIFEQYKEIYDQHYSNTTSGGKAEPEAFLLLHGVHCLAVMGSCIAELLQEILIILRDAQVEIKPK